MEDTQTVPPHAAKKVGIVFNLKHKIGSEATPDAQAEFDSIDTVNSIGAALTAAGYTVSKIEADRNFAESIKRADVDIVFNIAEGNKGRGREAQVPCVLNMLDVPFSGSDETTLAICLDKALTKRILSTYGVLSPKGVVVKQDEKSFHVAGLKYPVIVKPNAEGSSKGVSDVSVVNDVHALRKLLKFDFEHYSGDMLVEEFIQGREFTVALLGNGDNVTAFTPLEIVFLNQSDGFNLYSYQVKKEFEKYVRLDCPSTLRAEKQEEMKNIAQKVFKVLECKDFARIDFMMDANENVYFIEINPLPGLAPGYSDFPCVTERCGLSYNDTVAAIMSAAVERAFG